MSAPSEAKWKKVRADAEAATVASWAALAKKHDVPKKIIRERVDADRAAGNPWQPQWATRAGADAPAHPPAREQKKSASIGESSSSPRPNDRNRPRSRARGRTPRQLERQKRVWELSVVHGFVYDDIQAELKISRETVVADIRAEQLRRARELVETGEDKTMIAEAVEFYAEIARRSLARASIADDILLQIRDGSTKVAAEKKVSDRSFEAALKARQRIDQLLGIEALARVKIRKDAAEMDNAQPVGAVTIKRVVLEPQKVPVDEKGRQVRA